MTSDQQQAETVAEQTREALRTKGWCLWRTKDLGRIVVLRDGLETTYEVDKGIIEAINRADPRQDFPPSYTETELRHLNDVPDSTLPLVRLAKSYRGVTIMGVETQR